MRLKTTTACGISGRAPGLTFHPTIVWRWRARRTLKKPSSLRSKPVLRSERADHGFCAATARSTAASKQQRRGSSARRPCPSSAVVISQVLRC